MDTSIIKGFSVSGNEESVSSIISQLKFISKIKEGEKINVKDMSISSSDWLSRIYRAIYTGESRDDTLEFIKAIIMKAIELAYYYTEYEQSFYQNIAGMIFCSLQDSKTGLSNLIRTYEDDRIFVSKIEALISILEAKVSANLRRKN